MRTGLPGELRVVAEQMIGVGAVGSPEEAELAHMVRSAGSVVLAEVAERHSTAAVDIASPEVVGSPVVASKRDSVRMPAVVAVRIDYK